MTTSTTADHSCKDLMTPQQAQALCQKWLPDWTGNRPDALLRHYHPDVSYRDPGRPQGLKGHEELRPYFEKLLAANPDWLWEAVEVLPFEGGFCLKWRATLPVSSGTITEFGLDIVEVRDGLITRNEVYFDPSRLSGGSK